MVLRRSGGESDALTHELLELRGPRAAALTKQLRNFGSQYPGKGTAGVFGDYVSGGTRGCRIFPGVLR